MKAILGLLMIQRGIDEKFLEAEECLRQGDYVRALGIYYTFDSSIKINPEQRFRVLKGVIEIGLRTDDCELVKTMYELAVAQQKSLPNIREVGSLELEVQQSLQTLQDRYTVQGKNGEQK